MEDRHAELTARYERFIGRLEALLYRHDPAGIAFGDNPDEYSPEAGALAPRLRGVRTVDDVRNVVHAEFVRWFDEDTAGPASGYQAIAEEVWLLLRARPLD